MAIPTWAVGQVLAASDVDQWFVPLVGYKTSNTTRNTLTLSIDPDLQVTLAANAFYEVTAAITYSSTAGGFSFTWTLPSGATGGYAASFNLAGTGAGTYGAAWSTTQGAATAGTAIEAMGTIATGVTGGTFGLNWASGSGGPASLTCTVGSVLMARRIG